MKNALAALSVAFLAVSGLADDFEINLGPTNPQTIILQDGTNDLHLVVGTEAILDLEWQTFLTNNALLSAVADINEWLATVTTSLDSALGQLETTETLFIEMADAYYALWEFTVNLPLSNSQLDELDSMLQEFDAAYGSLLDSLFSEVQPALGVRPLVIQASNAAYDALYTSQNIIDSPWEYGVDEGWRYYDGTLTLSPATDLSGGGFADLSALQASLAELIVICSAIRDNTIIIADNSDYIVSQIRSYLHYLETIDSKLGLLYNLMLGWRDRLLQNGYFNVDWNKFKDNEAFRNTLLYNLNMSRPGYSGLPDLADYIVRFFRFPRDTYAVTNRYINGKPVPLVVSNVWSKAYAVVGITNILDSSGDPVPIWITNAVDRAAMDDMGNEADLQADLEGLDSVDVSVGTMDTSRIRSTLNRFSALSNDEPSTQILLFNGYQMGDTIVDTTHWNINHKNLRVLRNIRTCLQTFWVLSSALICISIALLSAFLAVRVTVFGYALLWGGDAVNAGNRLFDAILRTFGLAPSN